MWDWPRRERALNSRKVPLVPARPGLANAGSLLTQRGDFPPPRDPGRDFQSHQLRTDHQPPAKRIESFLKGDVLCDPLNRGPPHLSPRCQKGWESLGGATEALGPPGSPNSGHTPAQPWEPNLPLESGPPARHPEVSPPSGVLARFWGSMSRGGSGQWVKQL